VAFFYDVAVRVTQGRFQQDPDTVRQALHLADASCFQIGEAEVREIALGATEGSLGIEGIGHRVAGGSERVLGIVDGSHTRGV
jgi:hypothetical protein